MREVTIDLAISAQDYLAYYQGAAREVVATCSDGRKIRFPSNILQSFVTHAGIYGRFVIRFDEQNRFQGLEKIA